jgi:Endo-alpha-N-acetylgalactosaminidase
MSHTVRALCISCVLSLTLVSVRANLEISGEYYDWQKTLKPEAPWHYDYSQTLVMKMFLCSRDSAGNVDKVYLTFGQALRVIKRLDNLTLGIPKIIYIVGWQYTGHDSGYPSWSVVNEHLKRPQDKTALDSLKWLIVQARQYHTTVSLHINMHDAYENSPLWKTYLEHDVILKDKSGRPIKGDIFDGMQSYQISYAQEWKVGLAQKRIDELLRMLPELQQGGTIHIDAFHSIQRVRPKDPISSPYLGNTIDDEITAQRKIFRYWRMKGLDVTAEYALNDLRKDPFVGLQPMAWHFSSAELRERDWVGKPRHFNGFPANLYTATPAEDLEIVTDPEHLPEVALRFCMQVVPWYYANNPQVKPEDLRTARGEEDILLPALWRPWTLVACGGKGYVSKTWRLPEAWRGLSSVKVLQTTVDGLKPLGSLPVKDGNIDMTLESDQVVIVEK